MITPINTWLCRCSKCHHQWNTRTANVPERCANVECKKANWNDDYEYVPEPVEVPVHSPAVRPTDDRQAQLEALRAMIAPLESIASPLIPNVQLESSWRFTSDKPQYADDGNVYRMQYDIANPKRRRTVQVDENDHEKIID